MNREIILTLATPSKTGSVRDQALKINWREGTLQVKEHRQDSAICDDEEFTMSVWSIARAKNELAKLVEQAKTDGPQLIRIRRYPVVVVVSIRRWNAMLRRHPELEKFFWQKTIVSPSKSGHISNSGNPAGPQ